eukprot:1755200-Amphidinium_carterae.1
MRSPPVCERCSPLLARSGSTALRVPPPAASDKGIRGVARIPVLCRTLRGTPVSRLIKRRR